MTLFWICERSHECPASRKPDRAFVHTSHRHSPRRSEAVKFQMGSFGVRRQIRNNGENFELWETLSPYNAVLDAEKNNVDGENLWFLERIKHNISRLTWSNPKVRLTWSENRNKGNFRELVAQLRKEVPDA